MIHADHAINRIIQTRRYAGTQQGGNNFILFGDITFAGVDDDPWQSLILAYLHGF